MGVGPGNNPAIIDDTANIELSVNSIIHSKTFDNGMICATEQNVIVLDKVYDAVKAEFERRGCYFLKGDEIAKVGNTVIVNGALTPRWSASQLLRLLLLPVLRFPLQPRFLSVR